MKRFLMTMALILVLAPMAMAAEPGELSTAPEATENEAGAAVAEPTVEPEATATVPSIDQILGFSPLFSSLTQNRVETAEATCIVCPLTYCKRKKLRCDYVGCPRQTCCSFSCYQDNSCTSGKCRSFDCACGRILPIPL